ncbi:DUF3307 domain-containing protein [Metabacillus indicus]|uniref:DUF3307 domain-containing protein n=1 Tax=Metabacillus indicus TaxID=246786 RepID=UPI00049366C7|nr:DUF3307 domain-containing protein [Metabacillus indicus]KEZ50310.1 hypothetical protein AZ46_0206365 [Metabacillus indicus LMG 22858]
MIVLSLILAHLTADFLLQTDALVREKRKYLRKHLLHHTLLLLPVLLCFWLTEFEMANPVKNVVLPLVFIIATHGVIDFLKLKLLDGTTDKQNMKNLFYFLGDQFLHLAMIVLGCSFFLNVSFSAIAEKGITLITEKSSLSVPNAL